MKLFRLLAFPLVPFYYLVTWIRNLLYDKAILNSQEFNLPIICVGNLSVGGTGKTPMIEYLIRLLKSTHRIATLSRGYGRQTSGFILASERSNAKKLGDEPYQFYKKFTEDILVAVDESRLHGIEELMSIHNKPEVILLDDAYQHRKVKAGFNVLLTSFSHLYVSDFVLPTGNLREPKSGAKRAKVIVVTKCPEDIDEKQKIEITNKLRPKEYQHVFFSHISYSQTVYSKNGHMPFSDLNNFTLVTGIANPLPLVNYLKGRFLNYEHLNFSDHHEFSPKEIALLEDKELILTTEKDFVRLQEFTVLKNKLYYLPIKLKIDREEVFNKLIWNFIASY